MISSQQRIIGALVVGGVLIGGAFVAQNFLQEPVTTGGLAVVSETSESREHIITTDTDGDGIPDWQDALQQTEPLKLKEITTDTFEVPDTLTDQFAIDFFQKMVRAEGYGPLGDSQEEIVVASAEALVRAAEDELYFEKDIIISSDISDNAHRAYGNNIAAIILGNALPIETRNEAVILNESLRLRDREMINELDPIIKSYENMIKETLATPVPRTYVKEHLDLINTYNAILTDVIGMSSAFVDPLYASVRLKRYENDAAGLGFATKGLYIKLLEDDIQYTEGEIAAQFVTYN